MSTSKDYMYLGTTGGTTYLSSQSLPCKWYMMFRTVPRAMVSGSCTVSINLQPEDFPCNKHL